MATPAPEFEFLLYAAFLAYEDGHRLKDDKGGDLSEHDTGEVVTSILYSGCVLNDLPVPETEEEIHAVTDNLYEMLSDAGFN